MYNKKVLIEAIRNLNTTKNSTNINNGLDNNFKRGGSNKRPSLPKGKSPRSYSRSFEATNRLFAENPLFKKPKSRKNKIFDPRAQYYANGGLTQYAPGGASADPPDWLSKKGANLYFNPTYMNNFTGGTSTLERNMLGSYRTGFSPVVGIEGSLSKNRRADQEKGRGWLYNAYAGLNPNAIKEGNFTPSAGLNFDFENSPQDRNFRPHAQIGADYNPDTGLNIGATSGARFAFTPYGNKKIKPGYGLGHLDIYAGVRGGANKDYGLSGGLTYGARVHGKYMPERKSLLGKLMGKGAYFYGDAGIQFDPVKGQIGQKFRDYTFNTGAIDYSGNPVADVTTRDQASGLKFGNTIFANVGIKKNFDSIERKKQKLTKQIQDVQDKEIEYNRLNPPVQNGIRTTTFGSQKNGGISLNLTQDEIQKYVDGGYIVEDDISVPELNQYAPGGAVKPMMDENGEPRCPDGYTYNPETGWCEGYGDKCPDGYVKDPETGKCKSIAYRAIPGVLDENKKAIDRSKLEKQYTEWPEDLNLTRTEFDDQYGNVYIQPAGSYTIYSDNNDYLTAVPFYPDLNYKVEVDPNKPEGFDKSSNTYYVKSKDTHQYEKYRQWQILKQEEKENLGKILKAGLKTKIGETTLYNPNTEYKFSQASGNLEDEIDNELTRNLKKERDAFIRLYEDPEYIPEAVKNQSYDDYQKKRKQGNIEAKPCPECSLYHGSTYDIGDDYVRENMNLSTVTKEYPDVIFKKNEDGYEDAQNIDWEKQYTYADPSLDRKIPTYETPELELERFGIPKYEFTEGKYYPKKKNTYKLFLNQRYDTQPLIRKSTKFVTKKEDPLIRFITGYDREYGTPKLYKSRKNWNERYIDASSKIYQDLENAENVKFPSFRGVPIASWDDYRARRQYKRDWKDYVKNELPELRERNRIAQEEYNKQIEDLMQRKAYDEKLRQESNLVSDKYGGQLDSYAPGGANKGCPPGQYWNGKKCTKLYTLKNDRKYIDGVANWAMHVDNNDVRKGITSEYNDQIKNRLYSGKYGFDPESGALIRLDKIQPQSVTTLDAKTKASREKEKLKEQHHYAEEENKKAYEQSITDAGFDPATFGKAKGVNTITGEPIYASSKEEADRINQEAINQAAIEGHAAVVNNPVFKTAANFTPVGMAVGAIEGLARFIPDAYTLAQNPSWAAAGQLGMDALQAAPVIGKPLATATGKAFDYVKNMEPVAPGPMMLLGRTGSTNMVKKNMNYYKQLLDSYDSKKMSASNRKFYNDLIETGKKQDGMLTEAQLRELDRLKNSNFDFGKRGYNKESLLQVEPKAPIEGGTPPPVKSGYSINLKGAFQRYPKGPLTEEEILAYKNSPEYQKFSQEHADLINKYGSNWTLPNYMDEHLNEAITTGNRSRVNPILYGGRNWNATDYTIAGLVASAYPGAAAIFGTAFSPPPIKNKILKNVGVTGVPGGLSSKDTLIDITNTPMDFAKVNETKDGKIIIGGEFIEDANNTVRKAKDWLTATDTYSDKKYPSNKIESFYGIEDGKFKVGKANEFDPDTEIVPRRFGAKNIDKAIMNGNEMRLLDKNGDPIYQNTPNTGKFILYSPSTKKAEFAYITSGKKGVDLVNNFLKKNKDAQYIHLDNGRYEYYGLNPGGLTKQDFESYYHQDLGREGTPGYNLIIKEEGGETDYQLGDEIDEATMEKLKKLGYTFEKIK